jgi:hypothetical protein
MTALEDGCIWRSLGDGTIAGLLRSMDAAGVDVSVVCSIATRPSQVEPILKWSESIASQRIIPFGSLHPDTPDAAGWLRRFKDVGLRGVKMHPMYQEFAFDEPRMDPLYAAVAEAGLLLEPHCGYDIAFPGDVRADADRLAKVIDRHPTLRLICTHLGGWQQWDAVHKHLVGQNVAMETSMSASLLGLEATAALIRTHGHDKILFGTDWPWGHPIEQINLLRMLDLPAEQIHGILGGNAARVLGL